MTDEVDDIRRAVRRRFGNDAEIGNVVIPKSTSPERIRSNLDVFGFELDADDLAAIAGLESGERTGKDPDDLG